MSHKWSVSKLVVVLASIIFLSAVLDCCLWVSSYKSSTSGNLFTDFNRCLLSSKTCWRYLVISKHSWVVCGFLPPIFGNTPGHLTRTILLKLGEHEKYYQKTGGLITSRSAYDHKFYWNDVVKIWLPSQWQQLSVEYLRDGKSHHKLAWSVSGRVGE